VTETLALWEWRRAIADLYSAIRRDPDPRAAHAHWRSMRRALFAGHVQSPIEPDARASYKGPHHFQYDPALRFQVSLTRPDDAVPFALEAGGDGSVALTPFARTAGLAPTLDGELTLYWIGGYGGGVFLPFADATSGHETYGGGRYILDTIKGADLGSAADGRTIVDFNFAYFPSCAYSDRYICPLSPAENRLRRPVRAGERLREPI
jgi:uncharacterized protein